MICTCKTEMQKRILVHIQRGSSGTCAHFTQVRIAERVYYYYYNNIHICIAPYGRNFRGAGPGSVLVGVRRGKRVSLGEEKCL